MAKERAYCIAASLRDAILSMSIDWGWPRVGTYAGKPTFADKEGREVVPIGDCEYLRGIPRGTKIHLGYAAHRARGFDHFMEYWKMWGAQSVDSGTVPLSNENGVCPSTIPLPLE